jgi:hypothetical protein
MLLSSSSPTPAAPTTFDQTSDDDAAPVQKLAAMLIGERERENLNKVMYGRGKGEGLLEDLVVIPFR